MLWQKNSVKPELQLKIYKPGNPTWWKQNIAKIPIKNNSTHTTKKELPSSFFVCLFYVKCSFNFFNLFFGWVIPADKITNFFSFITTPERRIALFFQYFYGFRRAGEVYKCNFPFIIFSQVKYLRNFSRVIKNYFVASNGVVIAFPG